MTEKQLLNYKLNKLLNEDAGTTGKIEDYVLSLLSGDVAIADIKVEVIEEKENYLTRLEELKVNTNKDLTELR